MRINIDRLCELAGVPGARRSRGGLIRESAHDNFSVDGLDGIDEMNEEDEMDPALAAALAEEDEPQGEKPDEDDEIIEIDEKDLVNELRRIRVQMHEKRKIQKRRQQNLQESQLKAIIDQEVKNVIKELNLNSGWIYGKKKPSRSRKGYTHQGSFLKGIGFR